MARVDYRLPDQGEPAGEIIFLELQQKSHLQALIQMEDFNHLDVCWKNNMVGYKQSRGLL